MCDIIIPNVKLNVNVTTRKNMDNSETIYQSKEYIRSRTAYTLYCAFEYFITLLISDAFLAKLLKAIGVSDSVTGIISSIISFAFLFQLLSFFAASRIKNAKAVIIAANIGSQLLFAAIYLIPFADAGVKLKTFFAISCLVTGYAFSNFVAGMLFKWANSYVDKSKRGIFSAYKEVISLIGGMIFSLVMGVIVDSFDSSGNKSAGFLFLAITVLVLTSFNFICLMLIGGKNSGNTQKSNPPFSKIIANTLKNRNFRRIVVLTILQYTALYTTIGFMGVYKIGILGFSVAAVQIINIVANICRAVVSAPFGRFSDRHSYAVGMKVAMGLLAAAFFINIFSAPQTKWFVIIFSVLHCVSLAGSNQNSFNIVYDYVENDCIVQALAVKNCIGGVCGFLASLIASRLLAVIGEEGISVFGLTVYGQQILSAISAAVALSAVFYTKYKIENNRSKEKNQNGQS